MAEKSKGQTLVERIESFIKRYVHFCEKTTVDQPLVLALWVIHTWMYERFPTTPYMTISAATKQAGKTLCMEVLAQVSRNSEMLATLRPLALVRMMEHYQGVVTLFLDEAEKLASGAVGDLRSIFTTGYRVGGKHAISSGKNFVKMRTFAPKCFALIGNDVMDVVRDRSIIVTLERGKPEADFLFSRAEAEIEAMRIRADIMAYFKTEVPSVVQPMFLKGRDQEIWTVLYSIAHGMKLDKPMMTRLEAVMIDLTNMKAEPVQKASQAAEDDAFAGDYAQRALIDLLSVFAPGERAITTPTAVERMKAIPTSPWRTFKGVELTDSTLTTMMLRFGLRTGQFRVLGGGRKVNPVRGYQRERVASAIKALGQSAEVVSQRAASEDVGEGKVEGQ